jgi:hypothetical protein
MGKPLALDALKFKSKQLEFPLHIAGMLPGEHGHIFMGNNVQLYILKYRLALLGI